MAFDACKFKIGLDSFKDLFFEEIIYDELLGYVVRAMRFSYDVTYEDTISELANGTWTGLIGLLNRTEIDYSPLPFTVTEERWFAAAFNYPAFVDDLTFSTRKRRYSPEIMAIFRTVSLPVWLSLLISTIFVTLVFLATLKHRHSLEDIIFHVLATGLSQQGNVIPRKAGEFLLVSTWLLAMTLFTCCFKSVLLSFLSFPPLSGLRTVPELAAAIRSGKYRAVIEAKGSYLPRFLQRSPNADIRLIGENIDGKHPVYLHHLFEKSLEDTDMALIIQRSHTSFVGDEAYVSKDSMGTYFLASAVSKDFCCKEELDMVILRFFAAGIDQKLKRIRDYQEAFKFFSQITEDDGVRKISLTDIFGAFIFLVSGYCLSACTLIIELWMKNVERHRS